MCGRIVKIELSFVKPGSGPELCFKRLIGPLRTEKCSLVFIVQVPRLHPGGQHRIETPQENFVPRSQRSHEEPKEQKFRQMFMESHGGALMKRNTADMINYSSFACWAVGNG